MLRHQCKLFVNSGTTEEGERALRLLLGHDASDPEAHHWLGMLLRRSQRHDEAVAAYRQSLRYRTNFAPTYHLLGIALRDSGRIPEAAAALEQAVRLAPHDAAPRQDLARLGMR